MSDKRNTKKAEIQRALIWADGTPLTTTDLAQMAHCTYYYAHQVIHALAAEGDRNWGVPFARHVETVSERGRTVDAWVLTCPEVAETFLQDCRELEIEAADKLTCDDQGIEADYQVWAERQGRRA